jgi:hypothetical protein
VADERQANGRIIYGVWCSRHQIPSSPLSNGGRLCFAFRCDGRAISSGFARDNGCPGGAFGLRMLSKITLLSILFFGLDRELFLAIRQP